MDFLSLLTPLLQIGSSLFGTFLGDQNHDTATKNTATTGGSVQANQTDATTGLKGDVKTTGNTNLTGSTSTTDATKQIGNTSRLDATTKSLLTKQVQELLKSSTQGSTAVSGELKDFQSHGFNSTDYVNGIMRAATSSAMTGQESALNQISAAAGGNASTNSAASLLANKERLATADNLAGVRAQATADAEGIKAQRASTVEGLSGSMNSSLSNMLATLLNAGETSTTNVNQNQQQNTNQRQTNTQDQITNQTQTTRQKTKDVVSQNQTVLETGKEDKQQQDWQKFFTGLSKAFGTSFEHPATTP